ncbi:MAG: hypothetical protein P8Q92_01110 [Pseudoprimorskyibacter sp.]|jgi:hypothetical protein|nr:hypothetical protein [Pseudoprimorskyibacter sp.]
MLYLTLTPKLATIVFVLACLSGYQYRRSWVAEGPRWQLWVFGLFTASSFAILAFVPIDVS